MRYTLTMTEAQARVVQQALNVYFRLHLGQIHDAFDCLPVTEPAWYGEKESAARAVAAAFHHRLHPCANLGSGSLGVNHPDFKARAAVDIHDTIRHRLAWDKAQAECLTNHDGSRNWKTMLGVQYDEPMHYGTDPLPTIEQEPDHADTTTDRNPMARYVQVYAPDPGAWGGAGEPAKVNWSAIGSVPPWQARQFAAAIIDAADEADRMNAEVQRARENSNV